MTTATETPAAPAPDAEKAPDAPVREPAAQAAPSAEVDTPDGKPASEQKITLVAPPDSAVSQERADAIAALAQQRGLSQEAASGMLAYEAANHAELARLEQEWLSTVEADPELGHANRARTQQRVELARTAFMTPELKALLDNSRAGNHPAFVRLFERIGARLEEDRAPAGDAAAPPAERTAAERFGWTKRPT